MGGIIVKPRSRILHGHDWVFSSEILKVFGQPEDGAVISIKDGRDKFLGSAIYNSASHLPVRRFSRHRQNLDREFFLRRIQRAWEYRQEIGYHLRPCRVVWSESDGLPGVVVDRYGEVAVLQTLTLAMDQKKEMIAEVVQEVLGVRTVIERNDSASRQSEGLPLCVGLLLGEEIFTHSFQIAGIEFTADLLHGQKTGFYLDQMEAYGEVAKYAKGKRVLDCFANQGGFSLACAKAGAESVTAVESGEEATARLEKNALANGLSPKIERRDVFEFLRRAEKQGEQWDLIILDPPSFARNKSSVTAAVKGYRDLHLRAARLLAPHGILATFSCSHHITEEEFLRAAGDGFLDAARSFRLRERISQPNDHPILLHLPETGYLKGSILELLAAR